MHFSPVSLPKALGTLFLCGFMAAAWGWPSIFYVTGSLGMVVGIWILVGVAECPAQHPSMSQKEREYIQENFGIAPSTDPVSFAE